MKDAWCTIGCVSFGYIDFIYVPDGTPISNPICRDSFDGAQVIDHTTLFVPSPSGAVST